MMRKMTRPTLLDVQLSRPLNITVVSRDSSNDDEDIESGPSENGRGIYQHRSFRLLMLPPPAYIPAAIKSS